MQIRTKAYKESMKRPLRGRGYIMVVFGLLSQEAQANAKLIENDFSYFTISDNIFNEERLNVGCYATLEEDFTPVDGSMLFLPRPGRSYYDTGVTSSEILTKKSFELKVIFNGLPVKFRGLTVNFGANYPVDFDIIGDSNTVEIRGNDTGDFITEEVIERTNNLTLRFYKMAIPNTRVRIFSLKFGYGLVYYNDNIIDSTLNSYISPICAEVPQIDFSVTLQNYNKYFDVDNPKSALNFLETGQEMDVFYGYQPEEDSEIEWIKGNHLWCSAWESDDSKAVIKCVDIFRNLNTEYIYGRYESAGVTYYELARRICEAASIEDYYIDPYLKTVKCKNPIPRVPYKQALQMIANSCRAILTQTRTGGIRLKTAFVPESTISCNGETEYSNIKNILNDDSPKEEYESFSEDYTITDSGMKIIPKTEEYLKNTGYVSSVQSDENGDFSTNPIITIKQEAACEWYGINIRFGYSTPSEFIIRTFSGNSPVDEFTITEIDTFTRIDEHFNEFDKMEIEFTKTNPHNRIVVNYVAFGDNTDYVVTKDDILNSPKAIKQTLIKDIVVPCYVYQTNPEEATLITQEIEAVAGQETYLFMSEACYGYRSLTSGVTIVESSDFYVKVRFASTTTYKVEIAGRQYKIIERYATRVLNDRGETIKWENPLVSDIETAQNLADWLGEYYSSGIEYEYKHRGEPALDVNDILYQENPYIENMKVRVQRYNFKFNGAFSADMSTRRLEGSYVAGT